MICSYTLSTKDNVNLTKHLSDGFKRSAYWNSYHAILAKVIEKGKNICEILSVSFHCVKILFVLACFIAADDSNNEVGVKGNRMYSLPRGQSKNFNVLIYGRNFYDQPIDELIKQYDKVRKVSTGKGDDCNTGCLLAYAYFKDNYRIIAVDLSKQKALDADQQIVFQGVVGGAHNTKIRLYTILEKSKETVLKFNKGTAKVL